MNLRKLNRWIKINENIPNRSFRSYIVLVVASASNTNVKASEKTWKLPLNLVMEWGIFSERAYRGTIEWRPTRLSRPTGPVWRADRRLELRTSLGMGRASSRSRVLSSVSRKMTHLEHSYHSVYSNYYSIFFSWVGLACLKAWEESYAGCFFNSHIEMWNLSLIHIT